MRWYEYRMQVDELHAPDELKAKLLAMQPGGAAAAAAPAPAKKPRRKAIKFPAKRALSIAACAAVCVVGAGALMLQTGTIGMMGSSASSTVAYARSSMSADNGIEEYGLDTASLYSEIDSSAGSAGSSSVLTSGEAASNQTDGSTQEAKIIYTADLTLETKDYDTAGTALQEALTAAGGYMQGSDEYTYSTSDARHMYLTLRVPEENYESFLAAVAELGNVTYKSQQAEDVTTDYIDVQTRLENLKAQRTRLQELQAQAENLSDLLEIESNLTDVQSQIESWQSQLNWYDDQVSCCTVSITLYEVQEYTPTSQNFGEELLTALRNGWSNFVAGLQQIAVWLAGAWPVVVLVAVVVVVIVVVRRKKRG